MVWPQREFVSNKYAPDMHPLSYNIRVIKFDGSENAIVKAAFEL